MKDSANNAGFPYKQLGTKLKTARVQRNESVLETSGAVEIEPGFLERIEEGRERPTEDILMLLINHFDVHDQEAVQLWESAGYEGDEEPASRRPFEHLEKAAVMLLAMDARVVYSDGLNIDANKSGLVLNFTQTNNQQQLPIARVGISYEQAEQVLKTLQTAVLYGRNHTPRRLPPADRT